MDPRLQSGFLGTGASLMADLALLAYILLIVPAMVAGFIFARRRMYEPHHKLTMTTITLVNWALILYLMVNSYGQGVAPDVPARLGDLPVLSPSVHLLFGAAAQLLASVLVLRMWLENVLPQALLFKNIKRYMRAALALWLITAVLGIFTYLVWYVLPAPAADAVAPPATQEVAPAAVPETPPPSIQPEATQEVQPPEVTEESSG